MLFIIDMQNDYIDPKSSSYIKDSEFLVPGIIKKIKAYELKGDQIFYTSDINIPDKQSLQVGNKIENSNDKIGIHKVETKLSPVMKLGSQPYGALKLLLKNHTEIKKSYYAIPPEILAEIQQRFKGKKHIIEKIEFVGVETNICVLANAICVQSAFPDATIIVDTKLCLSKDNANHQYAIKIMESLGVN
ncbi:cysteine hydrolase [Tissierella creatinini]|nr:cysteine hydrolase [Tissierella creatinini]TJX62941.1 cysteine hydrolase [Soehngenia saccharolytica]